MQRPENAMRLVAAVVVLALVAIPLMILRNVARTGSQESLDFLAPPLVALAAGLTGALGIGLWRAGILRAASGMAAIGWVASACYHLVVQAAGRGAIDDVVEFGAAMLASAFVLALASRSAGPPHGVARL